MCHPVDEACADDALQAAPDQFGMELDKGMVNLGNENVVEIINTPLSPHGIVLTDKKADTSQVASRSSERVAPRRGPHHLHPNTAPPVLGNMEKITSNLLKGANLAALPKFKLQALMDIVNYWQATKSRYGLLISIISGTLWHSFIPENGKSRPSSLVYAKYTLMSLSALVARHKVPDVIFIVKFSDNCAFSAKGALFFPANATAPIVTHNIGLTCDVKHLNVPLPVYDWYWYFDQVTQMNGFRPMSAQRYDSLPLVPWEARISKAVWAGNTKTSGGLDGPRARCVKFGLHRTDLMDVACGNCEDFGATKREIQHRTGPCTYIDREHLLKHKYAIDLDGYGATFRLKNLYESGCVVMKVITPQDVREFWMDVPEPWVHYIPIDSIHLEADLEEAIVWCRQNDLACKGIAEAARRFALHNLTFEKMHEYQAATLRSYAHKQDFVLQDPALSPTPVHGPVSDLSIPVQRMWEPNEHIYTSYNLHMMPRKPTDIWGGGDHDMS